MTLCDKARIPQTMWPNIYLIVWKCVCECVCMCLSHMINQRHLALIGNSLRAVGKTEMSTPRVRQHWPRISQAGRRSCPRCRCCHCSTNEEDIYIIYINLNNDLSMFREAMHKKSLNQILKKLNKPKHLFCNEEGGESGKGRNCLDCEWPVKTLIHTHTHSHTHAHNRMPRWIVGRGIDSCKP